MHGGDLGIPGDLETQNTPGPRTPACRITALMARISIRIKEASDGIRAAKVDGFVEVVASS